MELQKLALRLLSILFGVAIFVFMAEASWEFMHAINPSTGMPLTLADLQVTATMVRTVASPFARAYNNILAMLLTFIALAIPLTANLYTPKLIEIFIRDRVNMLALCAFTLMAAHSLFAITLSFDAWTPQLPFWIDGIGAVIGWLILIPYFFYVLSFIDPLTIIKRIHLSLKNELEVTANGTPSIRVAQRRVHTRITNLGSMLQRSVDRADRDVAFDAIRAHILDLDRLRQIKPRLPAGFFDVDNRLMTGMSRPATQALSRGQVWMEHRIASQLVIAFKIALHKMPEAVGALAHAVKNAAYAESKRDNDAVFRLLVHTLNSFTREAIKHEEDALVYAVIYNYKSLIRRLLKERPEAALELVRYQRFYAEFARTHHLPFVYELISYELAELAEHAYELPMDGTALLLDAVLEFEGVEGSEWLVKSRLILAAYFLDTGHSAELARLEASLRGVPRALLEAAGKTILDTHGPVFWEITDRGTNIDYLEPGRRQRVAEVLERLTADAH